MAYFLVGAVVFLVLLFTFAVPGRGAGGGPQTHPVQQPMPQIVFREQPAPTTSRVGCQQVLALLFVAFLLFVGAVVLWSVSVQAGGGL
jgi:hypothetical protein